MNPSSRWRLALIMGLVYGVQGAWWPLLTVHLADLGVSRASSGLIFATLAIASMLTPFFIGQFVDRLWDARLCLSLIYFLGAGLLVLPALGWPASVPGLFVIYLCYWLLTAPGYGLMNSLVFRNLIRPSEQFGGIRLWGTVGWMCSGWVVSWVMKLSGTAHPGAGVHAAFWVAAIISLAVGAFSLTLPRTPPITIKDKHKSTSLSDARELFRGPGVSVYLVTALAVGLTVPFMYQIVPNDLELRGLSRAWVAPVLTLAQVPEIIGLAVLPWILSRLGYRGTLALGILAWVLRYGSLAVNRSLWLAILGMPLQGCATACFIVGGQMFLDSRAPRDLRASAQTLNFMLTNGMGSFTGSLMAGWLAGSLGSSSPFVFGIPCWIDGCFFFYVLALFHPNAAGMARDTQTPAGSGSDDGTTGAAARESRKAS